MNNRLFIIFFAKLGFCAADEVTEDATLDDDIGKSRDGSRTDDEVVQR